MPSSAFFSENKIKSSLITFQPLSTSKHYLKRYAGILIPAMLLVGIAVHTSGCASQKCDCPKFGGHHLAH
jgi:hypothetical protein